MRKVSSASLAASLAATLLVSLAIAPLVGAAAPADGGAGSMRASSAPSHSTPFRKLLRVDCQSDYLSCARGCSAMATFSAGNTSEDGYRKCARSCASDRNQCDISSQSPLQSEPQGPEQTGPQPPQG